MTAEAAECAASLLAPSTFTTPGERRAELRDRLIAGIGPVVDRLPKCDQIIVTLPLLRRARTDPAGAAVDESFSWKPAFVRRSLGLAVVDACVSGRFTSPAEAVAPVATEAILAWERTGWRTFHWEPWLAGLSVGARAAVLAEGLGWATALWSSLDWDRLGPRLQIGGCDEQWACPATRTVRIKGRSELRITGLGAETGVPSTSDTLVSVASGCPGREWAVELAFLALVAALRSPMRAVPGLVTGLWPDAGMSLTAEIDHLALVGACDFVVNTVASVVATRLAVRP